MKHGVILHMDLGVKQTMNRLSTGHVSVSIIEFGDGFHVPVNFSGAKSQAWSPKTVPNWSAVTLADGCVERAMGLPAALVAALLHIDDAASMAGSHGGGAHATDARCPATSTSPRTLGIRDLQLQDPTSRAEGHVIGLSDELYGKSWEPECKKTRRKTSTTSLHHGTRQVLGAAAGGITSFCVRAQTNQQVGELSEVSSMPTRTTDAPDTDSRPSAMEQHPGLYAPGLHQAHDQAGVGREIRSCTSFTGSHCQEPTKGHSSEEFIKGNSGQERANINNEGTPNFSEGGGLLDECSVHWIRGGDVCRPSDHARGCDDDASSTSTRLQPMQCRHPDADAQHREPDADVELRQSSMPDPSTRCELHSSSSSRSSALPQMPRCRDDADPDWTDARRDRAAAHEPQLQPDRPHLRAELGVLQNGSLSSGPLGMSGWWMRSGKHYNFDETFHNLLDILGVEQNHTYVTIGNGECVKGIMSVLTSPVISRHVILTRSGDVHWCAVDVTNVSGTNTTLDAL